MNALSLFFIRHNRGKEAPEISETSISYFDLTILLEGELRYRIDGAPVVLGRGDAILVPRGTRRARDAAERADYISFNFHAAELPPLPLVLREAVRPETKLMIAACDEIVRRHALGYEQAGAHLLCAILLSFQNDLQERRISPLTANIVSYINKNMAERITLGDIGRVTFFSPVYCDTVFKRDMGTSIIDYLLTQRVAEAKRLLLEGTLSLSEVARMTGFEDSNYFSRVFKKRTGYTPSAYKKMARADWL